MTTGQIIGDMVKVGAISFIWNKSLIAFGKKEFGQIIGASGLACVGIDVIKLIKRWQEHKPLIFKAVEGLANLCEKISEKEDAIKSGFQFFIDRGLVK